MKKSEQLVSIISPCYNGETKLPVFFDSILNQTYNNIEILLINDGSTDSTSSVCEEYSAKFEERGYKFYYYYQDNKGQAAALNVGLLDFHGKYLTWPDSDDYLEPTYIEEKVTFLEQNPDYNMVVSPIAHVNSDNIDKVQFIERRKKTVNDNLFVDLLRCENCYYPPGGYMVTSEVFFKLFPTRQIIESYIGQNLQLLLPIAFQGKYGYLNSVLYRYILYTDSHSHQKRTFEEALKKSDDTSNLMLDIIDAMDLSTEEIKRYKKVVEVDRQRRHFFYSLDYKNKKEFKISYSKYRKMGGRSFKVILLYYIRQFSM